MGNSGVVSEKSGWSFRISGFFPGLPHLGLQYKLLTNGQPFNPVAMCWSWMDHNVHIFSNGNSGVVSEKSG